MDRTARAISRHRLADLAVLLLLAVAVAVYCVDSVRASASVLNLILVLPLSVATLALCVLQLAGSLRHLHDAPPARKPAADVLPVICLFSLYVLTLSWLGFDVGTCLFLLAFLWYHGERRLRWLFAYAIGLSMALSLFFAKSLPYAMPMLVLKAAGS